MNRKSILLAGGCFDILHYGHVKFLSEAKKMGDILMVLLESDETVHRLKGENRPVFDQKERAEVLAALESVDFVILLPVMKDDEDYKNIIAFIQPEKIITTEHDPHIDKKTYQAKVAGATIHTVPHVATYSSSKLAQLLGIE